MEGHGEVARLAPEHLAAARAAGHGVLGGRAGSSTLLYSPSHTTLHTKPPHHKRILDVRKRKGQQGTASSAAGGRGVEGRLLVCRACDARINYGPLGRY